MKSAILSVAVVIGLASGMALAGQPYKPYVKPVYSTYPTYIFPTHTYVTQPTIYPIHTYVTQPVFVVTPGYNDYCFRHGVKFANGFYYEGFEHYQWSKIYFDPIYGCKIYLDPSTKVKYYWCVPDNRFYPVSYKPYGKYVF